MTRKASKIFIIGSTQYKSQMHEHAEQLRKLLENVIEPILNNTDPYATEIEILEQNRNRIEWADEVHVFWDRRSAGLLIDFGMAVMARKPIKIIKFEDKTFENLIEQYAAKSLRTVKYKE